MTPRRICLLIAGVSVAYLASVFTWSSLLWGLSGWGLSAWIPVMWVSLLVFGAEVYLFRLLFRVLKAERLNLALASGHLMFVCLFTLAMLVAINEDPIYALAWSALSLAIDPPVGLILHWFRLGSAYDSSLVTGLLLPSLILGALGSLQYYLIGSLCGNGFPSLRRICFLIGGGSSAYVALMLAFSAPRLKLYGVLSMAPLSVIGFGVQLYLFWLLFRRLGVDDLGLALASGHFTFVSLFSLGTLVATSVHFGFPDNVWYGVLRWIDPVATALLRTTYEPTEGITSYTLPHGWTAYFMFAVLGSLQYYIVGRIAQSLYNRRRLRKFGGHP